MVAAALRCSRQNFFLTLTRVRAHRVNDSAQTNWSKTHKCQHTQTQGSLVFGKTNEYRSGGDDGSIAARAHR